MNSFTGMNSIIGRIKGYMLLPERLFKGSTSAQFIKFMISGLLSAVAEYLAFLILHGLAGLWHIYANSVAMLTGFIVSFILNRKWAFKSQSGIYRQFILYLLLIFINMGLSNICMYLLAETLAVPPEISKIPVMGFIALWNFIIYKKIIFRK